MVQPDPHDREFFEQMRACRDPYRRLADCIHAVVGAQESAWDIGCGIGLQTARLAELGWSIIGAEHSPVAIELREPGVDILPLDLTVAHVPDSVDIRKCVVCTETAEHIPEHFSNEIVDNVTSLATDVIVWSAAAPGQEWPGHVNLQPPSYWITRFRVKGWILDEEKTARLRYLMHKNNAQHVLGKENFCVFVKKDRPLHMTITSTCLNAERYIVKCISSVASQTFRNFEHVVIDAKSDDRTVEIASFLEGCITLRRNPEKRKAALENCWEAWKDLPDDEIIIWLDGDDWLAHDRALEVVAHAYASEKEPWLTYGQFMFSDGEVGFATPYPPGVNVRRDAWRATHLKTFRAGLVKKLDPQDLLRPDGEWTSLAIDKAVMYPLLDMAGERYTCLYQVVSVYNLAASWWASRGEADRERELAEVRRLQAIPSYSRLINRPW